MEVGRMERERESMQVFRSPQCLWSSLPQPRLHQDPQGRVDGSLCKSQAPTSSPLQPEAQCIGSDSQPFHQPWLGPVDSGSMGGGYCPQNAQVQGGTHLSGHPHLLWFLRVSICTGMHPCGFLWICMLYRNVCLHVHRHVYTD